LQFDPSNFPKSIIWPLNFFKFSDWILISFFKFGAKELKFIKVAQKYDNNFFYYSIQTIIFRYESNLIESFELPRILNSSKFLNYRIQTHSNSFSIFLKGHDHLNRYSIVLPRHQRRWHRNRSKWFAKRWPELDRRGTYAVHERDLNLSGRCGSWGKEKLKWWWTELLTAAVCGCDEVEGDIFWTWCVLENREDVDDWAAEWK